MSIFFCFTLGTKLFNEGSYQKAYDVYTEALKIIPLSPDAKSKLLFNRALMSSKLGKLQDTIKDCSDSLKFNRTYLKAILLRAKCHSDLHNYNDCIKDYKAALKINNTIEIEIALKKAKRDKEREAKRKFYEEKKHKRHKKRNNYDILGLDKYASAMDIRRTYKKLALKHHPDRHVNASESVRREHERIFKEIGNAYEVLSDPHKRSRYDRNDNNRWW